LWYVRACLKIQGSMLNFIYEIKMEPCN
jgi:hypothetical protein